MGDATRAPERPERTLTPPPWRPRALVPMLLCAVGSVTLTFCDCLPNTAGPIDPPRPPLRPRYVLVRAGNQALPAVLVESGTMRVRLLADTLAFTITADTTRGTFTETVVLGVRDASGAETVTRTVSAAREWTRPPNSQLTLATFSGGGTTTRADASPFEVSGTPPQLTVYTSDGRIFSFEAR